MKDAGESDDVSGLKNEKKAWRTGDKYSLVSVVSHTGRFDT